MVTDGEDEGAHGDGPSRSYYGGAMVCEGIKSDANARLLASAPELLEACERALRLLDHDLCGPIETVELLKSAIKKAKGGGL